jgi:hypothetical protein
MRPKTPHHGARRVRVKLVIDGMDTDHRPVAVEPNLYLAEDVDDQVLLLPSDGEGAPLAVVPALTFDGLLRRREVVYLSW